MEQQRYGFNKEQGTKSKGRGAAIFFSFYLLFHIWLSRVKAHQIFRLRLDPKSWRLHFCKKNVALQQHMLYIIILLIGIFQ